jgi:hypothetical protein
MANSMHKTLTEIITAGHDKKKDFQVKIYIMESSWYSQFCLSLPVIMANFTAYCKMNHEVVNKFIAHHLQSNSIVQSHISVSKHITAEGTTVGIPATSYFTSAA